ncbi:hypothetical protein FMM80_08825 [Schaedlerella arabinosiphila]|jgi:hypothetical protein|uniref:Uncharacterized protein n=1 Tax=Schaedlerella arabinosiphila TaxID=2044587 RepID=A0A9X5CCM9_9FIRM|nr:hypothetical protein [Schaedlerella arabinosiphila]KAI4441835.1 hypothetical protein C824_004344 [Schaedlerella arabinosiphila]NDO68781.1 hypothetical protein [Schaedlerella arabinosiphila]
MENKEEFLTEVLIRVQRNYVHMVEIERLTKDMADSLSRNDKESVELLLKMRGEEMDQASTAKHEIQTILEAMDGEEQKKLRSWLNGENGKKYEPDSFESRKIAELSSQTQQVLSRTINLDKVLNSKVAGKESFYQATS